MKNFISIDNLEIKSSSSIKSFISASSGIKDCLITNVLKDDKNIWLSEDFLPQEIILNFRNIKLKEYPKKLTAIGIYCWNKYATNPKIIEVLISKEQGINFISLGHFDLSFKAGRQLIYLDDENDVELEELLSTVDFNDLIMNYERISAHCSNIAAATIEAEQSHFNTHEMLSEVRHNKDEEYKFTYKTYAEKFALEESEEDRKKGKLRSK